MSTLKNNICYIPLNNEDLTVQIENHGLFQGKQVNITQEKDFQTLLSKFRTGKLDYIIVPVRNLDNQINSVFLDLLSRLTIDNLIEIGSFSKPISYESKLITTSKSLEGLNLNSTFTEKDDVITYLFGDNECHADTIEYRIFKKNTYKPSFKTRFRIWTIHNDHLRKILSVLSILLTIVLIAFATLSACNVFDMNGNEAFVELGVTFAIFVSNFIMFMARSEENAKRELVTGKWIYYSFEEKETNRGFVPKGFRTRIVDITNDNGNLALNCRFAGEDIIFFSTDTLNFDYYSSERMGKGFYYYNSNLSNAAGRRAEGTCRFEGEAKDGHPIMTMNGWFFSRGTGISGRVRFYRISDEDAKLLDYSSSFYLVKEKRDYTTIGVYGAKCSNTDISFRSHIDDFCTKNNIETPKDKILYIYFDTVDEIKRYLEKGFIDYAVVPVKNKGIDLKDPKIFESTNFIYEFENEIRYVLAALDEEIDIEKSIYFSHKEALNQCSNFLIGKNSHPVSSTSKAAQNISEGLINPNSIAICNANAAEHYKLKILKTDDGSPIDPCNQETKNVTTFRVFKI